MRFHREGRNIILITLAALLVLNLPVVLIWPTFTLFHLLLWIFSLVMLTLILRFFRAPKRGLTFAPSAALSGADGHVVVVERVYEPEFFKDERIQVSVFMSVHNVHINWFPLGGKVRYYKYHPGSYLIARHPKSSTENERTSIVIEDPKGNQVLMRQIAGTVARRIICYAKENEEVQQGSETGFIRFGSRVDLFLPTNAEILVQPGQKVKGRLSVIAKLP